MYDDALIGRVVGGYRIEALIGRGGMGVVYRAVADSDGKVAALKLMNPQLADDPAYRARFLREADVRINHPNIIPIEAAGSDGSELYIAMRYVNGHDLATLFKAEGKILPTRLIRIGEQAARALDAAHQEGVVHRDVKPQNILVEPRGSREHVFLTDFGLVKRLSARSSMTAASGLLGSIDYMSPEQISGEALDGRADVYGFACVLYEALTGSPPFRRDSDIATLWAQVNEEPPSAVDQAPSLPDAVDPVFRKGMAKSRDDRYLTATELVSALKGAFAAIKPAPAAPRTALSPPRSIAAIQPGATPTPVPVSGAPGGAPWVAVVLIGLVAVGSLALLRARDPSVVEPASSGQVSPDESARPVPTKPRAGGANLKGDSGGRGKARPRRRPAPTALAGEGSIAPRDAVTDPPVSSARNDIVFVDPDRERASARKQIVFAAPASGRSTNNGEIFVMDSDGSDVRRLTHNGAGVDDLDPEWSPDGERIAFVSDRAGSYDLYVMEADGSGAKRITKTPHRCEANPTWAPDGKSIVFDTYCLLAAEQSDLYSVSVKGGPVTNLTRNAADDFGARWSPNGTQIAFTSDRGGFGEEIYVMDANGSRIERLTFEAGNDRDVAWAPGGAAVAFSSDRDGNSYDVYVMDLSDGRVRRLTSGAAAETSPTWSPDGGRLAFLTNASGVYQIWTMSRVGRNQTRILTTTEHFNQWSLAWHS